MVQKIRVSSDNKSRTAKDDSSMAINLHQLTGKTPGISTKQRNYSSKEKFIKSSSSRKSKRTFPFSSRVGGTAVAVWGSNDGVGSERGSDGVGSGWEAATEGLDSLFGVTASSWVVVIDELWAERNGTRIHDIAMKLIMISCWHLQMETSFECRNLTFNFNGREEYRWSKFFLDVRKKARHEVIIGDNDVIQITRLNGVVRERMETGVTDDALILNTVPKAVHGGHSSLVECHRDPAAYQKVNIFLWYFLAETLICPD